ncbi:MAG TPA: AAA domain-containing protein [Streptosporangiaceae bacterium]
MSWREEIGTTLEAWIAALGGNQGGERWQRVGTARPTREPGAYAVDIRGSDLTADQADDLRLAGPEKRSIRDGFPVLEARADGELLRVRVAEFAAPAEPHVWRLRQQPTFLVTALRDELAALTDAGLANLLARGEVGGTPAAVTPPPGLLPAQQDAYRACLGSGLWLVWGPPGTGKTRLLRAAVSDLVAAGKRVLLVSGTNIAVDNALLGVVRERRHQPGEVVRVGPPQLREIADDPQVCLPLMVRARLAEVERQRCAAAMDLLDMDRRQERWHDLEARLAGFDAAAYETAAALLANQGPAAETSHALAQCELLAGNGLRTIEEARRECDGATSSAAEASPARGLWAEIDSKDAELAKVEDAALQAETRALVAENAYMAAKDEIVALQQPAGKVRWRDRGALREARRRLDAARPEYGRLRAAAAKARSIASAFRQSTDATVADLTALAVLSREEIQRRDAAAARAKERVHNLEQAQLATLERLAGLRTAEAAAQAAEELVTRCTRRGWPGMHAQAEALRSEVAQDKIRRRSVDERHNELQQQYEKLARDAQGEIIRAARLVATTLARFRTTKAVLEGPYDVVLIDEVGAATLPEVLLAVAKASRCAVLLGDFMQLGPVLPPALEASNRADIRRWLVTDTFRHCGITTPTEALSHPACLVLDTQHRFGPHIMELANLLAYDGLLKPGEGVRSHAEDDHEIVLIDTDGLHELAQVHRVSNSSGWWPAGLLLARALVELHDENGETTGVITPYVVQAEATLEALRDMEPGGRPLAEVGTAHRFQGREFPIVVFDTVEPWHDGGLWMSQASRLPGSTSWQQKGVRLFNVATTRVQHRLYVIASRERVRNARPGTAFGHLGTLLRDRRVPCVAATSLIAPQEFEPANLGPEGRRLAEVLARHVEITDIHDERSFYDQFADLISHAQISIWLWSAWVASRVRALLPLLNQAVDRGVRVTVFVRDPSDTLQKKRHFAEALNELRAVVPNVVEINVTHEKVVVIDDHTVMFGSLNTLSQQRSREVMVTMRGHHWAHKLLTHLHAEEFSRPPCCGACNGQQVDLRRKGSGSWYWRCYSTACPEHGKGSYKGWTREVVLRRPRY